MFPVLLQCPGLRPSLGIQGREAALCVGSAEEVREGRAQKLCLVPSHWLLLMSLSLRVSLFWTVHMNKIIQCVAF